MQDINFEEIGKRIREVRISKGLTQEFIANYANVNTSHISNIENNRVKVSLTLLVNICNAMEITTDYILSGEYKHPSDALDQRLMQELQKCSVNMKERILKIIIALQ